MGRTALYSKGTEGGEGDRDVRGKRTCAAVVGGRWPVDGSVGVGRAAWIKGQRRRITTSEAARRHVPKPRVRSWRTVLCVDFTLP